MSDKEPEYITPQDIDDWVLAQAVARRLQGKQIYTGSAMSMT